MRFSLGNQQTLRLRSGAGSSSMRPVIGQGPPGLNADGTTAEEAMTAVDADSGSTFRVQQDARLAASYVAKGALVVNVMDHGAAGDGSTDDSAALTAALAAGDEVLVPFGRTLLVSDVVVSGKTISGPGTIKKAAAAESALHLQGDGSTVRGVNFAAASSSGQPKTDIKLGDGATNILIQGNTFRSPHYSAIAASVDTLSGGTPYTTQVDGVQIIANRFVAGSGNYSRPLYLHSVKHILIQGNLFRDTTFDAIRLRENDGWCSIIGNQFVDIGDSGWADTQTRDAVDTHWSGTDLLIADNIVDGTAMIGFDVKGANDTGTESTQRVIIVNNHISRTRLDAIYLYGQADYDGTNDSFLNGAIIAGNVITYANENLRTAHAGPGVSNAGVTVGGAVKRVQIRDNFVGYCAGNGINIRSEFATVTTNLDVDIVGNHVLNCGTSGSSSVGINVTDADWLRLSGNTVVNDSTAPNPGVMATGVAISRSGTTGTATAKTVIMRDNIIRDCTLAQLSTNPNNDRATIFAVYRDNLVSGSGTLRSWQAQRSEFAGVNPPTSAEGSFVVGDFMRNSAPSAGGGVFGWVCTTAGNPGTWTPVYGGAATSTTTALAAVGNAINTTYKATGRMVFNTTTGKPVWATGSAAADTWVDATGTTAHTPV